LRDQRLFPQGSGVDPISSNAPFNSTPPPFWCVSPKSGATVFSARAPLLFLLLKERRFFHTFLVFNFDLRPERLRLCFFSGTSQFSHSDPPRALSSKISARRTRRGFRVFGKEPAIVYRLFLRSPSLPHTCPRLDPRSAHEFFTPLSPCPRRQPAKSLDTRSFTSP